MAFCPRPEIWTLLRFKTFKLHRGETTHTLLECLVCANRVRRQRVPVLDNPDRRLRMRCNLYNSRNGLLPLSNCELFAEHGWLVLPSRAPAKRLPIPAGQLPRSFLQWFQVQVQVPVALCPRHGRHARSTALRTARPATVCGQGFGFHPTKAVRGYLSKDIGRQGCTQY